MRTLPSLVTKACYNCEAWIVGSAANPNNIEPRDYDVIVPYSHWHSVAIMLPDDVKKNTFGGWKCVSEGKEVDIWPGELSWILTNKICEWAWHPRTDTRIRKYEKQNDQICKCGHNTSAHENLGECFWSYNCDCKKFQ